jgi:hypothetical protein
VYFNNSHARVGNDKTLQDSIKNIILPLSVHTKISLNGDIAKEKGKKKTWQKYVEIYLTSWSP